MPINPQHGPSVLKLSSVQPTAVRWLWQDRLALGKLTLLAGDPGLGKSFLTLDLAARVSAGRPFPGETSPHKAAEVIGGLPSHHNPQPHADAEPRAAKRLVSPTHADTVHGVVKPTQPTFVQPQPPRGVRLTGGQKVILLSAEDDPADTIRPRLDAAGADCDNVLLMKGIRFAEKERSVNLREDLIHLEAFVKQLQGECRLIIIDPISAYLGDDEGHSNTKVRNMLAPLSDLAQKHRLAILAVTHLNKGSGNGGPQNAIYRTMGSLAFTAAARAVHLVARDKQDPTGQRRLMLPVKNNLGMDRTGWAFRLAEHTFTDPTGGDPDECPTGRRTETKVIWEDQPTQETADELLMQLAQAPSSSAARPTPAMDEAIAFLQDTLANGPKPAKQVQAEASELGISPKTLRKAREATGVTVDRLGGRYGQYQWSCPAIKQKPNLPFPDQGQA
ncbi:MAG: AAA family ATPase [Planctomycetota bacterium]